MIRIGQLAKLCDVNIKTIRFYEEKGILMPASVDEWTSYRYYDEKSVERVFEIKFLKELGFSLKEIKNFSRSEIEAKIENSQRLIDKLRKNIDILSFMKRGGKVNMFVNDEKAIGKWKKVGEALTKESAEKGGFAQSNYFPFDTIYFLPEGESYWVFSWTKGILRVKENEYAYSIEGDKMYVEIGELCVAYQKEHSEIVSKKQFAHYDNIGLPFKKDDKVLGLWESVDLVKKPDDFNPIEKQWKGDLFVKSYSFLEDGSAVISYADKARKIKWTKAYILDNGARTASKYIIKEFGEEKYMIAEWKSGDYTYGGKVNCYYVFKKVK